jgi:hypothetical protein
MCEIKGTCTYLFYILRLGGRGEKRCIKAAHESSLRMSTWKVKMPSLAVHCRNIRRAIRRFEDRVIDYDTFYYACRAVFYEMLPDFAYVTIYNTFLHELAPSFDVEL